MLTYAHGWIHACICICSHRARRCCYWSIHNCPRCEYQDNLFAVKFWASIYHKGGKRDEPKYKHLCLKQAGCTYFPVANLTTQTTDTTLGLSHQISSLNQSSGALLNGVNPANLSQGAFHTITLKNQGSSNLTKARNTAQESRVI